MSAKRLNYRDDIQGLRGLAVLLVILFHLKIGLFKGGFIGVDVFFVISGYLITRIIITKVDVDNFSYFNFYYKRFKRLYPALVVCLLLCFVAGALLLGPFHFSSFADSVLYSLFSLSNMLYLSDAGYFDLGAYFKPLLHTWSLSVEWQFYVVWPALTALVLARFSGAKARSLAVVALVLILFALQFFFLGLPDMTAICSDKSDFLLCRSGAESIYFLAPARAFEFALGALVVFLKPIELPARISYAIFTALILVLLALSMIISANYVFPSFWGVLIGGSSAALIYFGDTTRNRLLDNPVLGFLGKISYSLYLYHWPVIVFWYMLDDKVSSLDLVMMVMLFTGLAIASFYWVEMPFQKADVYQPGKTRPHLGYVTLGGVAVMTTAACLSVLMSNGWTWRAADLPVAYAGGSPSDLHRRFYGGYVDPIDTEANPPKYLLVGDSHGAHYAHGFNALFEEGKITSWQRISGPPCFHLPEVTRINKGRDFECYKTFEEERDLGKAHPDAAIVMSYSYFGQMRVARHTSNLSEQGFTEERLLSLMENYFKQVDNRVIVFGMVPTTRRGELWSLMGRTHFVNYFFPVEDWKDSEANQDYRDFNAKLAALTEQYGGTFIDPFDVLCEANRCRNVTEEGHLIYSDGGHLYQTRIAMTRGTIGVVRSA